MRAWGGLVLLLPLLTACPSSPTEKRPTPAASAIGSVPKGTIPAASASAGAARPWYVGTWRGKYDARRHALDVAPDAGRLRAWDEDDGKQAVGVGELEVVVDATGVVTGTAKGVLGNLSVTGAVEGDSVRLRLLSPAGGDDPVFAGYLVAERHGDQLRGVLQASSGDSALVRRAEVELQKRAQ